MQLVSEKENQINQGYYVDNFLKTKTIEVIFTYFGDTFLTLAWKTSERNSGISFLALCLPILVTRLLQRLHPK